MRSIILNQQNVVLKTVVVSRRLHVSDRALIKGLKSKAGALIEAFNVELETSYNNFHSKK